MLRLTLAQMRRSVGRLAAATVAVAIGTAFVAATLLAGGVMQRSGYDAVTATYAHADLVVRGTVTDALLDDVRRAPGVEAADPLLVGGTELRHGASRTWQTLLAVPSDDRLATLRLTSGSLPDAPGEVALPVATAERLRTEVGDTFTTPVTDPGTEHAWPEVLTVVGIVDDPSGAWSRYGGAGLATLDDVLRWSAGSLADTGTRSVLVATGPDPATARAALERSLPGTTVQTRDEAAAEAVSEISDGGNVLTAVVLGFAAVALLVAALVIANTFQVLVAQRVRTLALLRCVGATKGQLRRSVLTEAGILGAVASAVGLLVGTGLAQATLVVLRDVVTGVPLPRSVDVTPAVVLVPLLVGTAVTVLASLVPAHAATAVPPVSALRPADAPTAGGRAGRVRLGMSLLLTAGGVAGLLLAVVLARSGSLDAMLVLALGLLAGAVSFVGVLLGAVFWVPWVVALVGRVPAGTGPTGRIAAANTVRNPRRTAATSSALLIGVTLVVMMSTGAASARASLSRELADHYPVDLTVEQVGDGPLPASVLATVAAVPGVEQAVEVPSVSGLVGDRPIRLVAPDPALAARVLRSGGVLDPLTDGTVVLPAQAEGYAGPAQVTGSPDAPTLPLDALASPLGGRDAVVTPATLALLAPGAQTTALWVRLDDSADPARVLQDVREALPDTPAQVESAAAQRHDYERIISTLLAVVVGLLAVAVVIALVGVANTLSLSVLERRRESATLRAIGLTRRGLRWMLAVEGMLVAFVGAALGALLGLLYGWAGAATTFGQAGEIRLAVPWADLALVLAVALLAGLLASVLPARSAARTPPVAALGVD